MDVSKDQLVSLDYLQKFYNNLNTATPTIIKCNQIFYVSKKGSENPLFIKVFAKNSSNKICNTSCYIDISDLSKSYGLNNGETPLSRLYVNCDTTDNNIYFKLDFDLWVDTLVTIFDLTTHKTLTILTDSTIDIEFNYYLSSNLDEGEANIYSISLDSDFLVHYITGDEDFGNTYSMYTSGANPIEKIKNSEYTQHFPDDGEVYYKERSSTADLYKRKVGHVSTDRKTIVLYDLPTASINKATNYTIGGIKTWDENQVIRSLTFGVRLYDVTSTLLVESEDNQDRAYIEITKEDLISNSEINKWFLTLKSNKHNNIILWQK